MTLSLKLSELTASANDRARLEVFYADVYEREFPDPDERESLANIEAYLELKENGWYGRNNYHVVVAYRNDEIVGGCILDYLAEPNAGMIEFLFTVPAVRGGGIGHALLTEAERLAAVDARRVGQALQWMAAEMNDPFVPAKVRDDMDAFQRARIWGHWGFGALDCPYVQPALSDEQRPAEGLMLIAKPLDPVLREGIPAAQVRSLVGEYLRWAMRIEEPERNPQFAALSAWLAERGYVAWTSLGSYIGEESMPPFEVRELRGPRQAEFAAAVDVYRHVFDSPSTSVDPESFVRGLKRHEETGYRYHLWAVLASGGGRVAGMASFFSFVQMGFGGYIALEGELRGVGCLRPLLARMEHHMMGDALGVSGWLIECESASSAEIFRRVGFYALDIGYVQPSLAGASAHGGAPLILMYKRLGRVYEPPELAGSELLNGLAEIFRYVYRIKDPAAHPTWRAVAARVGAGTVQMYEGEMSPLLAPVS